jgi:hypothetical protein
VRVQIGSGCFLFVFFFVKKNNFPCYTTHFNFFAPKPFYFFLNFVVLYIFKEIGHVTIINWCKW